MKWMCLDCGTLTEQAGGSRCPACQGAFEQRLSARRNAEMGGSGGRWQTIRRQVRDRQEGRCAICGSEFGMSFEVDHIRPRSAFRAEQGAAAASSSSNLQALCRPCHQAKTTADRKRVAP